jgi:hypothetical protein
MRETRYANKNLMAESKGGEKVLDLRIHERIILK